MRRLVWLAVLSSPLLLTGCGSNSPAPATPFSLQFTPASARDTVPGQKFVFLMTAKSGTAGPVALSAAAPGASVTVEPSSLVPGRVAEVIVVPEQTSVDKTLTLTCVGQRNGATQKATADVVVNPAGGTYEERATAATDLLRDRFVPWLEANHPEMGITRETAWTGTIVAPNILVVMHYLFLSQDWEAEVMWHIMIPPYDWAKILLRRRFVETAPSLAFEIPSVTANDAPRPMEIESGSVWRH